MMMKRTGILAVALMLLASSVAMGKPAKSHHVSHPVKKPVTKPVPKPVPPPVPPPPVVTPPPPPPSPPPVVTPPLLGPSGVLMPTGDIPGWHQVFADNFTQNVPLGSFPAAVASTWGNSYPDGWTDTTKNGTYMPSKVVSIANGVMNLNLHTENGVHMVAAPVPTIPGAPGSEGGLLYGRYVIRFRADAVPGHKTAWLLWPDSETWPADGEID